MASIPRPLSGRRTEREALDRVLASDRAELVALYGRRRVGKTFLVRRYFQDQAVVYFEMVGRCDANTQQQLTIFAEALSVTFYPRAALASPESWHDAFRALVAAIEQGRARKRKYVLFFDEVPWIDTHRSGFLRELEHFWNSWCSRRDDIVVIVCGSAASWMLSKVINARGGLHNRLTRTIRLLPFSLAETSEFFEHKKIKLTRRELCELYMVFGGVPHYLESVARGRSVAQVVDEVCFSKDGVLNGEFDRLFASLFGDDPKYVAVVRALAKRRRGLTRDELLDAIGVSTGGGASKIITNLEEGGFITSSVPFGRTERDRFLRLTDEFSLFHLKWMDSRRVRRWRDVHGTPAWQVWSGLSFESVCLRHVHRIERALGISGVRSEVSAWLHKDAQIDLLIDRADGVITVCEIKFTDQPFEIQKRYAEELRQKLDCFRRVTKTRKSVRLVFVTPYGLVANRHSTDLVDSEIRMDAFFEH